MKRNADPEIWKATARLGYAYYAAYGSNLNRDQMQYRCPMAKPVGTACLPGWELAFRGVADVVPATAKDKVPVGVYRITPQCEAALDRYEGYPYLYTKATAVITLADGRHRVMFYRMNDTGEYSPPARGYLDCIRKGYADFGMTRDDVARLNAAVERSRHEADPFIYIPIETALTEGRRRLSIDDQLASEEDAEPVK